jgi:hypothetical protein
MKTSTKLLLGFGVAVAAKQFYTTAVKRSYRKIYGYAIASDKARKTGKPLVVLGDPTAGNFNWFGKPDYPNGDFVIDIEKVNTTNGVVADIRAVLPTMQNNSCVLYTSGTLEYINNLPQVLPELMRVTGGDLFVTNLEPDTLKAALLTNFGYHFSRHYKVYTNNQYKLVFIAPI